MKLLLGTIAVTLATVASGCGGSSATRADSRAPLRVVVSISSFVSFAREVGGARVQVDSLVPVGASPENYQPTPADIERLHGADILVENGLGLEAWLTRTVENAKNQGLRIVVCTNGLPKKDDNPHLWMDPVLAHAYVRAIRDAFSAREPADRVLFARNAAAYERRLDQLQRDIAVRIATIPPESRAMIVFHNAWQYYNDRFGLRTIGVLETSPGQEPNPEEVARLVALAKTNHVRAVFAEPEYSPKLVQALAESAGIATVENLYDDSVGTEPQVADYESMLRYDTEAIVKALGGRSVHGRGAS